MRTEAQREASRINGSKSKGPTSPGGKAVSRFNGLKHGLTAEQIVLPGEDPAAFEARRREWFDDFRPTSHAAAVLCDRAAIASWRLDRAVRVGHAHLYDAAADAAHEFDTDCETVVEVALHILPREPVEAVARLHTHVVGVIRLIGLWEELADAVETGWTSRADHHERLLNLLGHVAGPVADATEAGRASLALLRGPDPAAAAAVRAVCAGRLAELREERSRYWDPDDYRRHLIDRAIAPTTKEAQLLHRYEMEHEKSLRWALRQLTALEKSGVGRGDVEEAAEPAAEPESTETAAVESVTPESPAGPEASEPSAPGSVGSAGREPAGPPRPASSRAPEAVRQPAGAAPRPPARAGGAGKPA